MKLNKAYSALLAVVLALSLAALACGAGNVRRPTAAPVGTNTPQATRTPRPEPSEAATGAPTEAPTREAGTATGSISELHAYVDSADYLHLVGTLSNDSNEAMTSVEMAVTMVDADGNSVLKDLDGQPADSLTVSPLLYTIGPGETSPFDFYMSLEEGTDPTGWTYEVSVVNSTPGEVNRARVEVQNDRIATDDFGNIYLTGELVNLSDSAVVLYSLAGGLTDDSGTLYAADSTFTLSRFLDPAGAESGTDRTPFVIVLDGPADNATQAVYYFDADLTSDPNPGSDIDIAIVGAYIDEVNRLHVVSNVTNNGSALMNVGLIAGLYDTGGIVLDASSHSVPIYVAPGETVPATFEYFGLVDYVADQMALVDSYTVQIDPYWTFEGTLGVEPLESTNDTVEVSETAYHTIKGEVVNSSNTDLSSAALILALFDQDGNLVSSTTTSVYPEGDTFAAGASLPYEAYIYMPTDVEGAQYTLQTFVQGYAK